MALGQTRAGTEERRAEITAAALRCFAERGIEGTTVQHICRTAGCSVGSLYHHFGNKDGVAEALLIEITDALHDAMLTRLRRCQSAEESVRTVVESYASWVTRHRERAQMLHARDLRFSAEGQARLKDLHRRYLVEVFRFFAPFVLSGAMRQLPSDAYVPLITGAVQEYARRWLAGQAEASPRKLREVFADAAWQAVRGRSGS